MKPVFTVLLLGLAFLTGLAAQSPTTYATNFPLTEDPIAEAGRWINGQQVGRDWKNVQTTPGLAFGVDASGNPTYNDPTALLTGTWAPNQTVEARVHTVNQQSGNIVQEVAIRLRSTISAHRNEGYQISFRCAHDGSQYVQIVRWNGPVGDFAPVQTAAGPGLFDGDIVKATIVGNVITAYINGLQVVQGTDSTFANGNPGMGFYVHGISGANADFGFTTFSASDGAGSLPSAPMNLRLVPSS